MFCKINDHYKNFCYCENCAIEGKEVHMVFFCERCHRAIRMQHQAHKDEVKQIELDKFKGPFDQLKLIINQQLVKIKQKFEKSKQTSVNFTQTIKKLKSTNTPYLKIIDEKEKFIDIIRNQQIMKWLLTSKFWQCSVGRTTFMKFQNRFSNEMQQKIISVDKSLQKVLNQAPVSHIIQKFTIDWQQTDTDSVISKKLQKLKEETILRIKQQEIYNVVIKMYQSYLMEDCYQVDDNCSELIKKYPESKALYLCRIRLNEMLPGGNKEIYKILGDIVKNVDKKFDSTDYYHYYLAMAQWEITEKTQNQKEIIFFELKNKKYYRMINPDVYIDELNKAIGVREKPIYYISLGLGYVVKKIYHEALRVFKKASSMLAERNDALDANKFWTDVQMNPNYDDFDALIECLETRTLQFIVNICKYFKKSKNYQELVTCCEQLILREPNNKNFKIQFIKSILSYTSKLRHIEGQDDQKISRAQYMIIELKNAQENSAAGQLDKKLKRLRAKYEFKNQRYYDASEGYEILARGTKFTTGSDYYNYAGSLFKLFVEEQCTDDDLLKRSYEMIIKALNLKPNNKKYKKLKFYICTYMNKFNEANEVYEDLKAIDPKFINYEQYERMIQYIKDNQQI